jgi:hypothetical protein
MKNTVLRHSSGNWNFSGIRISSPMRKTQSLLLYRHNNTVYNTASSVAGFSSLAAYSFYQQKQGTTIKKNHTSISLSVISKKTG